MDIFIDRSKLGVIKYGQEIAEKLKEKYAGRNIVDVCYDYFAEGFYIVLDNGEILHIDI